MADDEVKDPPTKAGPGLQVIHASLPRMGTQSMSRAYRTLGLKTHHCLDDLINQPWVQLERAFEASFPSSQQSSQSSSSNPPKPPFTRQNWDSLWGSHYDVVTDLAAYLVPQLIAAYPPETTPVVIVQRDFESWYPSWQTVCVDHLFHHWSEPWRGKIMWYVFGLRSIQAMNKGVLGFLGVEKKEEINKAKVKEAYERFYDGIREMVPPERRLEYNVGKDGWEPLCEFLGKEVPDVPFPRMNDRKTYVDKFEKSQRRWEGLITKMGLGFGLLAVAAVAIHRAENWPILW